MLADQLDYIVGVDPHRDSHALAVVQIVSGTVVFETTIDANSDGYAHALQLVDEHAPGRRAFAIEGTGSFGAGLTRFLTGRRERVLEVSRLRRERRSGGKTDALDAVRAARSVLTGQRPRTPSVASVGRRARGRGQRQTRRSLPTARLADHHTGAAAQRAATANPRSAPAAPRNDTTRRPARSRAPRQHARAALNRSPGAAADRRRARTRTRDRDAHPQPRTAAARPTRRRPTRRRTTRALLVTPRPDQLRSRLRPARRRRPDSGLIRPNDPPPARPKRRPQAQPRPAHDPRHTQTHTPRHDRLHRTTHPRRQDTPRSKPLPQALPRPQPLPAARTRTAMTA